VAVKLWGAAGASQLSGGSGALSALLIGAWCMVLLYACAALVSPALVIPTRQTLTTPMK
jgi:hypothetical protein